MAVIIIALIVLILLVLAPQYGYDSRESARSKEEEMASYGMSWDEDEIAQPAGNSSDPAPAGAAFNSGRIEAAALPRSEDRPSPRRTTAATV